MRKIHVLTHKEEIDESKVINCTAVVIDVLFATSTIAAVLDQGANMVIPVMDQDEALQVACSLPKGSFVLSGEKGGYTIEGFLKPDPVSWVQSDIYGKTVIFSTTNGTVAIKKAMAARTVYISSILNGSAVAKRISSNSDGGAVLIVCGGSHGRFAMEDMLGAGYLISEIIQDNSDHWRLSDSAKTANMLYQYQSKFLEQALLESETGLFLSELGYNEAIRYASKPGVLPVVPRLQDNRLIIDEE